MRIAFYAPLKAPSHATPSGDRRMARLLQAALSKAGHEVFLASEFRSYDGVGDRHQQEALQRQGAAEAKRLLAGWRDSPSAGPPDLWFTYHVYHKAPDWLGPPISSALAIPYVIAEASHAPKQTGGPWDLGHRAAAEAIAAANVVFCMTRLDMACVAPLVPAWHQLCFLPPFVDAAPYRAAPRDRAALAWRFSLDPAQPWLLSVGMMRPGDKLDSYQVLASALRQLAPRPWQLLIVGDGPVRTEVERAFAPVSARVRWAGALPPEELPAVYAGCDLYLWPGVGEAYGMAYLEAQAAGLPVVAGAERGVPDVVDDDVGGLLVPPGEPEPFAAAVDRLLADDALRQRLAEGAGRFAGQDRDLAAAAALLQANLP